jgi:uronate dehydrogenase
VQNAEDHAAEILGEPDPPDPVARTFQGGGFSTMDYARPEDRPRHPAARSNDA